LTRKTIARHIIDIFEKENVNYVFGMPGYQNVELYDCIHDSQINNVLVTNETLAPFMADGYSYVSGQMAVCVAIPGPGFTNMFTGLSESFVDSFPLLVLVSGTGKNKKCFGMHDIEQHKAVSPLVKAAFILEDPEKVNAVLLEAFHIARAGDPGPVVVEVPENLFQQEIDVQEYRPAVHDPASVDQEKIDAIVDILKGCRLCGIYIGKGAAQAIEELLQLSQWMGAPVASTLSGRGLIPEDNELSVGFGFGPTGMDIAENVFHECDCLLAVGCKFTEVSTGQWGFQMPSRLIHIDINQNVLNKNYTADVALCADARQALTAILRHKTVLKRDRPHALVRRIAEDKKAFEERLRVQTSTEFVSPPRFYYELRKQMDKDALLVVDCGYHQLWSYTDYKVLHPQTYLTTSNFQAMGFSIPAAIGAKLASPAKDVVCLCGDGCFLMNGFELLTAKRQQVKIICIVFNDCNLGLIKHIQSRVQGRTDSIDLVNLKFQDFARAIDFDYFCIQRDDEIAETLTQVFSVENSVIVDVNVSYEEEPKYYKGLSKTIWQRLSNEEKLKRTQRILERKRNEHA
jgi:acetolactate synthase-1/2/3 large subunit